MEAARAATAEDLPALEALATALVAELSPTRGGAIWARREAPPPDLVSYFTGHLDVVDRALFAGTIGDEIVGFATVSVETLRGGDRLGVVAELYVDPEARAVGVGEALADIAVEWCRAAGCVGIDARALPGNRAAKNFFETHGFVARAIVMHRDLS